MYSEIGGNTSFINSFRVRSLTHFVGSRIPHVAFLWSKNLGLVGVTDLGKVGYLGE